MTSEIDKLKHFHVEDYSGTNFTDDLNDGEEFLYTTIRCKDDKAVFASHGNSGSSAPWEINLVQRLCDWDIISPLRFTDDEWSQISSDGTCQNRRKFDVFKEPDGSIHYNGAFNKRPISRYNFATNYNIPKRRK